MFSLAIKLALEFLSLKAFIHVSGRCHKHVALASCVYKRHRVLSTSPKLVFGVMLNRQEFAPNWFPDLGCGRAAGCESAALAAGGERQAFDGYLQPGTLAEPWGPVRGLGLLLI